MFLNVRVRVDRAWLQEMTAIITSDELGRDVSSAEALINRHKEHRAEVDTRLKDFSRVSMTGKQLIADGHFLSQEVSCRFLSRGVCTQSLVTCTFT